jgi:hypothetical protein
MGVQYRPPLGVPVGPQWNGTPAANVVIEHHYSSRPGGRLYDGCGLRVVDLDQPTVIIEIPNAASVIDQGRAMLIQGEQWPFLARIADIYRVWNE